MTAPLLPIIALHRDELPADTLELARYMVGKYIVHDVPQGRMSGRIVETEAYPVGDSTSYAFIGRRPHNDAMFLARGHAHVRLTYGVSYMFNMSSEEEGTGAGILFRAIEPLEGLPLMQARRPGASLRDLARGPGRLSTALGIGMAFDGVDLCAGHGLWVGRVEGEETPVAATTRIGLSREMHHLRRFYVPGSPFVSGPRKLLVALSAIRP
ncbi:DNA-3-methyladenine glycosylase [Paraburkholderia sp. BCC1885]|uniref:DNA-3-methyladenine glycosylase n=1 Tax=Paraburkholderia sp. BCC1885 TaxID=2562669 RepID=UPI001182DBAA|nr:DNA-3-methyladenine glycosylase [Paraburkholderia sp. BCC1885]